MIAILISTVLCTIAAVAVVYSIAHLSFLRMGLILTGLIGGTRIATVWMLVWIDANTSASQSPLMLVILLWPEATLIAKAGPWSIVDYLVLSVMLMIGSAVAAFIIATITVGIRQVTADRPTSR